MLADAHNRSTWTITAPTGVQIVSTFGGSSRQQLIPYSGF
jgi:hypothetical protein